MNKFLKASIPAAIAMSLVACGGGSSNNNDDNTVSMRLSSTNLEALGDNFDYEGWIIVDGSAVSTGKFDIVDGATVPASFDLDLTQANAASTFVLTIEPEENDPAGPADTHILAGPITDGVANIVTDHPGAFNTDFEESEGTFIVATPTNGNATPTRGIWYLTPPVGDAGPTPSLRLPVLPAGWLYEGWVAGPDGPVSTGTFTSGDADDSIAAGIIADVTGSDSDSAGPAAGRDADGNLNAGPPFPGQDFVDPALDLVGLNSVISVEPFPDNSTAPFVMKPLIGPILGPGENNVLGNEAAATLPSATVTIEF